jgi:hypothetical protein
MPGSLASSCTPSWAPRERPATCARPVRTQERTSSATASAAPASRMVPARSSCRAPANRLPDNCIGAFGPRPAATPSHPILRREERRWSALPRDPTRTHRSMLNVESYAARPQYVLQGHRSATDTDAWLVQRIGRRPSDLGRRSSSWLKDRPIATANPSRSSLGGLDHGPQTRQNQL